MTVDDDIKIQFTKVKNVTDFWNNEPEKLSEDYPRESRGNLKKIILDKEKKHAIFTFILKIAYISDKQFYICLLPFPFSI